MEEKTMINRTHIILFTVFSVIIEPLPETDGKDARHAGLALLDGTANGAERME